MQHRLAPKERVVTPEQYAQGYFERDGMVVKRRPFELIRRLPDGNYLVRQPQSAQGAGPAAPPSA
jgi:hypothetical protein